jgi:hypothetical protein
MKLPEKTVDLNSVILFFFSNFLVNQFDINSCQARDITNDGESHEFMGYCKNKLSFWCQGKYI